jgi:hypothetical protein
VRETKRLWKKLEGAKIEARVKIAKDVEIDAPAEFSEQVRRDAERLKDIDPVADVAERLDLDAAKLKRVADERTSYGRCRKPKPKPKN